MKNIVEAIIHNPNAATDVLADKVRAILEAKIQEMRKMVASKMFPLTEKMQSSQKQGRLRLIKVRIRNGKVQRRVKKSDVSGFSLRKGKLVRMSPSERRHRKMGARKAARKRRSQKSRINMKRARSMRKRKAMGY